MAKFKIGDRVRVIEPTREACPVGSTGTVRQDNSSVPWIEFDHYTGYTSADEYSLSGKSGYVYCLGESSLELITTSNKIMSSIKSFIKSVTRTEPEKSFVKAGFIDENENLTEKGREALEFVLWDANKDAVKAIADQVIAVEEVK